MSHASQPSPSVRAGQSDGAVEADIRPLMSAFPSGVSVITTIGADSEPRGMTCSSLASVALSPPTIVLCLRTASPTVQAVLETGHVAVNLLHENARPVSDLFASGAPDRFGQVEWRLPLGAGGPHLTEASHAIADGEVTRAVEFGDHTAVFVRVNRISQHDAEEPLLFGKRRYARWTDATAVPGPPAAAPPLPAIPAPLAAAPSAPKGAARVRP
ncbi:flavin reductase family protein [Streptomyces sp. NBC_00249]|uniref:flavin reductase family protein n=1 Tax=Streptomyces sp. NBC_00249 TaxID=2975690 RepID=UPI002256D373|nr:flavin reductase family protein [Streptomyces sp. NBC_00249]MCX5193854.1 flavin reductase family protein [Streptomyces sp. NBC_00249]